MNPVDVIVKPDFMNIFHENKIQNQYQIFYLGFRISHCTELPLEIHSLEIKERETRGVVQISGTLCVHDVMAGPAPHNLLIALGYCLVHSDNDIIGVDEVYILRAFDVPRVLHHSATST